MNENEMQVVQMLKKHLSAAKWRGYPREKMIFCDGILAALCELSGKDYGFSDGEVYYKDEFGNLHWA